MPTTRLKASLQKLPDRVEVCHKVSIIECVGSSYCMAWLHLFCKKPNTGRR